MKLGVTAQSFVNGDSRPLRAASGFRNARSVLRVHTLKSIRNVFHEKHSRDKCRQCIRFEFRTVQPNVSFCGFLKLKAS
jgi:hypothetical protein